MSACMLLYVCAQAVGASGAAALRPALHKAATKGVTSIKRVTLESAEQSKKSLCLALLQEVRGDESSFWGFVRFDRCQFGVEG